MASHRYFNVNATKWRLLCKEEVMTGLIVLLLLSDKLIKLSALYPWMTSCSELLTRTYQRPYWRCNLNLQLHIDVVKPPDCNNLTSWNKKYRNFPFTYVQYVYTSTLVYRTLSVQLPSSAVPTTNWIIDNSRY